MENNKFIITEPELYLQAQSKTLDQRLRKITISKEQEQDIIKNKTIKTIRDKILGSFKLCSWAGLCPGNNESAGKKKSTRTREGNKSLRGTMVESARSCVHCKDTYFYSQYNRIATRRGKNRAAVAVAHSMLIIIYNMIKNKSHYRELGSDYFDNLNSEIKVDRLKKKLESLGYSVAKQEIPA